MLQIANIPYLTDSHFTLVTPLFETNVPSASFGGSQATASATELRLLLPFLLLLLPGHCTFLTCHLSLATN
jgi:hypothetical protein